METWGGLREKLCQRLRPRRREQKEGRFPKEGGAVTAEVKAVNSVGCNQEVK